MNRLQRIEQTRFLGREFLLWLWFYSEQHNSTFNLEHYGEIELFIDDKLVLEPIFGEGNRHSLSGYDPATSPEAALALLLNKIPSEAKFKILHQDRAWAFSLKGDDLQLRSLKIPEILSSSDEEKIAERLYLIEEIEQILLALFSLFLKQRISPQWPQDLQLIQQWIHEKSNDSESP